MAETGNLITLADGRKLAYAEYGDPKGEPIFFFHGSQSCRLERHPDESIARDRRARVIGIDRPGHGLSDFQPDRTLLDWPDDVVALADALGFEKFAVMGMSAGGPYALACAYRVPERLTTVTIIASAAPLDKAEVMAHMPAQAKTTFSIARRAPWLVGPMLSAQRKKILRDPEKAVAPVLEKFSPADQRVLARPEVRAILPEMFAEAYRLGHKGVAWEITAILAAPWGFSLSDVSKPVILWQGEADTNVPVEWGQYLAGELPFCTTHFLADEGHLLIFDHFDSILAEALA